MCDDSIRVLISQFAEMVQGTAFSVSERERLELRGLLPKKLLSMETQVYYVSSSDQQLDSLQKMSCFDFLRIALLAPALAQCILICSCVGQVQRLMEDYEYGRDYISADHITDGGVTRDHVRRWKVLQELQVTTDSMH
jgi:hypothetical protein